MAENVLVDASFIIALLTDRDTHHEWADTIIDQYPPTWNTCEPAVSEALFLLGTYGATSLIELLRRRTIVCPFRLDDHVLEVIALMQKYSSVPMSLADACLVRMSETLTHPILLTTDSHFRIYRRHSRQVVPCVLPEQ